MRATPVCPADRDDAEARSVGRPKDRASGRAESAHIMPASPPATVYLWGLRGVFHPAGQGHVRTLFFDKAREAASCCPTEPGQTSR
jgi:hypothetical protein